MRTQDPSEKLSESALHTRNLFDYCAASLNDLDNAEALEVARQAARELVLLIIDLSPAPLHSEQALVEISTLCQHGIVALPRWTPPES